MPGSGTANDHHSLSPGFSPVISCLLELGVPPFKVPVCTQPYYQLSLPMSSITAPQDAHKRLVLQVAEWFTASLFQCSREGVRHELTMLIKSMHNAHSFISFAILQ